MSELITKTPGICGGKPCIAGHRIRVSDIAIWHDQMGLSVDEIVSEHPGISLAEVLSALAYYHEHLDEIREEFRQSAMLTDQARKEHHSLLESRLAGANRTD